MRKVNMFDGDVLRFPYVFTVNVLDGKRTDHPLVVRPDDVFTTLHAVDGVRSSHHRSGRRR